MNGLKTLAVLALVAGAIAVVTGTGAFSAVDADRTSGVDVTSDQSALVGLDIAEPVSPKSGAELITVTNNVDEPLTVRVSLTPDTDSGVSLQDTQKTIPPGKSATFNVNVDPLQRPDIVEFQVQTSSIPGELEVSLTRTANVAAIGECAGEARVIEENVDGDVDSNRSVELGSKVQVKSDVSAAGCVILNEGSQIKGDTNAGGRVEAGENAKLKGDVDTSRGAEIGDKAEIKGDLDASKSVDLGSSAQVKGDLSTDGSLSMAEKSQVKGDADVDGSAILEEKAQIGSDLTTGGSADIGSDAIVKGSLSTDGSLSMAEKSQVKGDADVDGSATLEEKAQIGGDLDVGGGLTIQEKTTVDGDVSLTKSVTLNMGSDSNIKGSVEAEDPASIELICSPGAEVDGVSCEDYTIE